MNCEPILEETLDEDLWKDSFDHLLDKRSLLRELKVIKDNVRVSFNIDSSIEVSKNNSFKQTNLEENKTDKNEKGKPSGSISTPILINKAYGPFDCTLSPISTWRLTHFNQRHHWESSCKEKSFQLEKVDSLRHLSTPSSTDCCGKLPSQEEVLISSSIFNNIPKLTLNDDNDQNNSTKDKNLQISGTAVKDADISVVLPRGKWRRSLSVWKRLNQIKYECLDHNSKNDVPRFSQAHQIHKQDSNSFLKQRKALHVCANINKSQIELLKICEQTTILLLSDVYSDISLRKCRKIGEGTYGEVFLNSNNDGETVLKIIPIEGDIEVNGEPQKTFEQILPEVIITKELSNLRQSRSFRTSGFVFLKTVRCLKGKYPDHLKELWDLYDKNYGSENDHPAMFNESQLYVSLEIAYSGKDLERFVFRNSEQAYAAFLQVTLGLAVAEKSLQFEHRDLHCGNILIQSTNESNIEYMVNNKKIKIPTNGIKATIIDYTLSRMSLNKCCYYNDLSKDDELFCAKGDYQYDIYRLMKNKLGNNWKLHEPQTNIMWLHYVLTKLTNEVKYKNFKSKQHILHIKRMKTMQDTILNHNSAFEFANKILP